MSTEEENQDETPRLRRYRIKGETFESEKFHLEQRSIFLSTQYRRIYNWKPKSDVWPLLYGSTILAGMAGLTGAYFISCYRRSFRLFQHGVISTYLPTTVCPAVISYVLHEFLVMPDLMLPSVVSCPSCLTIRSGTVQTVFGAIWPLTLSPLACILVALKHYTIPIDHTAPIHKTIFPLLRKTSPKSSMLLTMLLGNFLVGMWVAGKKGQAYETFLYMADQKQVLPADSSFDRSET